MIYNGQDLNMSFFLPVYYIRPSLTFAALLLI